MFNQSYLDQRNCLLQILTCLLCKQRASQAHVCPNCSKFFCYPCITTKIMENNNKCPYCFQTLRQEQLVNSQKLCLELSNILESMEQRYKKQVQQRQKICDIHKNKKQSYCCNCQKLICAHCNNNSLQHRAHQISNLSQIGIKLKNLTQKCQNNLKQSVKNVHQSLKTQKETYLFFQDQAQNSIKKLQTHAKNMQQKVSKSQLITIKQINTLLSKQSFYIEQSKKLYEKQLKFLKECRQAEFLRYQSQKMKEKLKNQIETYKKENGKLRIKVDQIKNRQSKSQILPEYMQKTFSINKYTDLCQKNHLIYTQVLSAYNLEWRLKIYPTGNSQHEHGIQLLNATNKQNFDVLMNKDKHISIFIQLKKGLRSKGNYRHKIIIQNFNDSKKSIERQFESQFEQGQCWGYDRFTKVQHLYENGFINFDSDQLKITLMIAPSNFYEANMDLMILEKIQNDRSLQNHNKIRQLKLQLQKIRQEQKINNKI